MLDVMRYIALGIEALGLGVVISVIVRSAVRHDWINIIRLSSWVMFMFIVIATTYDRIGKSEINWVLPVCVLATVTSVGGFILTERRFKN